MKLLTPNCSICGEPACAITESLLATAGISQDDDGEFDYIGESKIHWDTQEPVVDPTTKHVTVECENEHEWTTEVAT